MEKIKESVDNFHIMYEKAKIWSNNSWMGVPCWKLPFDAFVIQELIVRLKPDWIIETGTGKGGSAMFYASICELMGQGQVITVDIENRVDWKEVNQYDWAINRINFLQGSSIDMRICNRIYDIVGYPKNEFYYNNGVLVILDSWHTKEHVYQEMLLYSKLVNDDGYMIIEDSHANGNPVPWEWSNEGPMGAIDQWLETRSDEWEVDLECEKHLMTFNPKGYLRRRK